MGFVKTREAAPGYEVYEIEHPRCRATVARHGAQVLEWTPAGATAVLYRSPRAVMQEGKALRAGIPLCWPWFGNHPTDATMPAHGLVRTRFWKLEGIDSSDEEVTLRFSIEADAATLKLWPHRFRLEAEISLGARLRVRLASINRGDAPFLMGGALHSYFAIGALEQTRILGLEESPYFDKTGGGEKAAEGKALVVQGETDSIYRDTFPVRIIDGLSQRTIAIDSRGHAGTVVWNPGAAKAATMADLPPDAYRHFVAVEAALPPGKEILLAPGGRHVLETGVSVTS